MDKFYANTDIAKWVERNRLPQSGVLDAYAMAKELGIEIYGKDMRSEGLLVPKSREQPYKMFIDIKQSIVERRFIFGHEVGHWYIWEQHLVYFDHRVFAQEAVRSRTELFCDWFARELLLPKQSLDKDPLPDIEQIYLEFGVSQETVLLQFMALGRAPNILRMADNKIICLKCCGYEYFLNKYRVKRYWDMECECAPYRRNNLLTAQFFGTQISLPF